MNRNRKAEICDAIIYKFLGNKSYNWKQIQKDDFYKEIDGNYFVVENMLNFLIAEGQLVRYDYQNIEFVKLTAKGFGTLGDMEHVGYVASERRKRKEDIVFMLAYFGWIPILYSLIQLLILLWKGILWVTH